MTAEQAFSAASVVISLGTLAFSTYFLSRQNRHLEHERNALAILDAIGQLTDPQIVRAFKQLEAIGSRYPDDQAVRTRFEDSDDDDALTIVAQYVETVSCLARRGVLDASLIVDAVGFMLRYRWSTILPFVERLRRVRENEYLFENFEWLAVYSVWWKEQPRPPGDRNYDPAQFRDVEFKL
ncbi:MAG: DUF4760 domain-containing protein [Candidatus Tumulicola sp.]